MPPRARTAKGELAVLDGGPWSGCWYWRNNIETLQTNTDHTDPALHQYRPTEQWRPHPTETGWEGRVWAYQPPLGWAPPPPAPKLHRAAQDAADDT